MSKLTVLQRPSPKGVAACSSTRIGGVSLPLYDSLNLGAHCGDNPDRVGENRERLFAVDNLSSKPIRFEQVHGRDVLKPISEPHVSKRVDASYSNTSGTVYAVMIADCLPILFYNRAGTEVAAAHVSWCGLCAGVLEETASCSADNPENILAWLGPAIGPRTFEVGVEVREAFMAVDVEANTASTQYGGKYPADIYQLTRQRLVSVGVEQIFGGDRCTYTENETSFSYCRDKTTGYIASFIWLM